MIGSVMGASEFSTADHFLVLGEERLDGLKSRMTSMAPNSRD